MLKIDVFILGDRPYDREAFARRITDTLEEGPGAPKVQLSSAEDTILAKLEWYRLGQEISDRQWRDVIGVLRVQSGALDEAYLDRWAQALHLSDLLARARAEALDDPRA